MDRRKLLSGLVAAPLAGLFAGAVPAAAARPAAQGSVVDLPEPGALGALRKQSRTFKDWRYSEADWAMSVDDYLYHLNPTEYIGRLLQEFDRYRLTEQKLTPVVLCLVEGIAKGCCTWSNGSFGHPDLEIQVMASDRNEPGKPDQRVCGCHIQLTDCQGRRLLQCVVYAVGHSPYHNAQAWYARQAPALDNELLYTGCQGISQRHLP